MLSLLQITNNPDLAQRCDALGGFRLFVDLERHGKAERQAGRNTFISNHQVSDVGRIKAVLRQSRLMVRLNPVAGGGLDEVDGVLAQGADILMLPMFTQAAELAAFCARVAGRVPVVALLETRQALETLAQWIATPGLHEVYVGLNDLHLSLGCRFMFEPLAQGLLDPVAQAARQHGLGFGFGGIARLEEGLLPGRVVLAEHLRLGSSAVILSRTFHRADAVAQTQANALSAPPANTVNTLEVQVAALRACEAQLAQRSAQQIEKDRLNMVDLVASAAARMP